MVFPSDSEPVKQQVIIIPLSLSFLILFLCVLTTGEILSTRERSFLCIAQWLASLLSLGDSREIIAGKGPKGFSCYIRTVHTRYSAVAKQRNDLGVGLFLARSAIDGQTLKPLKTMNNAIILIFFKMIPKTFFYHQLFFIWSEWRLTVIAATVRITLVDILDLSEVDIPAGGFLYPAVGWG